MPCDGIVCRKCWCQIELFHSFYRRIENIHKHEETVFVDTLLPIKDEETDSLTDFDDENGMMCVENDENITLPKDKKNTVLKTGTISIYI